MIEVVRIGNEIGVVAADERGTGIDLEFQIAGSPAGRLGWSLGTECAIGLPWASNMRPTMMESLPTLLYWPVNISQITTKLPVLVMATAGLISLLPAEPFVAGPVELGMFWEFMRISPPKLVPSAL